jgi:cytochrome c biogenesis protein CcmG/thiol:disulfide interchange protein DsbE
MRKLLFLLPILLFLTLAGYFAIALRPGHDPNMLPSAMIDKPTPAFDLASLTGGERVAIADLKGQVVVVNFFASWCVPCRIEHPILMRLAAKEHLAITGIAYKDRPDASRQILKQLGDPYKRIGVDEDGRIGLDFGVYGVPETYVIDRQGRIRKRFVGPLNAETIERELLPLVKSLEQS